MLSQAVASARENADASRSQPIAGLAGTRGDQRTDEPRHDQCERVTATAIVEEIVADATHA